MTWWFWHRSERFDDLTVTNPIGARWPLSIFALILGHSFSIITHALPLGASPRSLSQVSWSGNAGFIRCT